MHLAPGEQLRHSGSLNVADLVMFTFLQFNISHEIHYLALGDEFPVRAPSPLLLLPRLLLVVVAVSHHGAMCGRWSVWWWCRGSRAL